MDGQGATARADAEHGEDDRPESGPLVAVATADRALGDALAHQLRSAGYRVCAWHERGRERSEVDLLLADKCPLDLPVGTGAVPLILVGKTEGMAEAFAAGADDYLSTPVAPDDLLARAQAGLMRRERWSRQLPSLRRRARELELLLEATRIVSAGSNVDSMLNDLARMVAEALDARVAILASLSEDLRELTCRGGYFDGMVGPEGLLGHILAVEDHLSLREAIERREIVEIEGNHERLLTADERRRLVSVGLGSGLTMPLIAHNRVLGILGLLAGTSRQFSEDEKTLAWAIAQQAAAVIAAGQLYEQSERERQRLRAILDQLPEAVVVAEAPSGLVVAANRAAEDLWGEPLRFLPDNEDYARVKRFREDGTPMSADETPLLQCMRDGRPRPGVRFVIEQPGGRRVRVLTNAAPLRDAQGRVVGAVVVWQDITALQEMEELKADFLAMVTHELRTPLAAIKGCASALLHAHRSLDDERSTEMLRAIDEQVDTVADLVDDLLDMSRIEAGELQVELRATPLETLLRRTIREQRQRVPRCRIDLFVPPGLPLVEADTRRIRQVLHNLLDNAAKFSPRGEPIVVRVRVESGESQEREGRPGWVVVSIADRGIGIAQQHLSRIFDKFYRVEDTEGRAPGGQGLGLAICRAIVEAHGGQIWAESKVGEGSTFHFTLPLATRTAGMATTFAEESAAAEALAAAMAAEETLSAELAPVRPEEQAKILVLDDDQRLRQSLQILLERAGHTALTAGDAGTAIELTQREQPDLVLLDLLLPDSDGFEVCARIRELSQVPIIMISGMDSEEYKVQALDLGADDYLTKPFSLQELLARVRAVLRRAAPPEEREVRSALTYDGLTIDFVRRRVTVDGREVKLTGLEYRLLHHLAINAGRVVAQQELLQRVWGPEHSHHSQYLWVHIRHLREKLEPDPSHPRYLLTEHGVGYLFVPPR